MTQTTDRNITAAFTGHRHFDRSKVNVIKSRLTAAILECYGQGIRCFISGFAQGFDIIAAECVVELKTVHSDISLIAAIPYAGYSDHLSNYGRQLYDRLLAHTDQTFTLSDYYYARCFLARDEFMVSQCSRLIAYYDGRERGGTYYTVRKAKEQGIPVLNLF